jgi:replication-associated recombination protein RarA
MDFDPWTNVKTKNGFKADEIISALQKEIRRGNTENAALIAYEMIITSRELEKKLWERLLVISVEDIGWGNLHAPVIMDSLFSIYKRLGMSHDRGLVAIHGVRFLCSCKKDRSSDEMYTWIRQAVANEGVRPIIPEYALDMHTARGMEMCRGQRHFLEEATKVHPELENRTTEYRKRLFDMLND